jgi:Cytochrome C oxidase, cbb3-type, subunit III
MKRRLSPFPVSVGILAFAAAAIAGEPGAGKAVYEGAKPACKGCHTDVKNPLARAGAENTPEELAAWVRTPKEMMAKKGKTGTMPSYPPARISDADLENLVAYMATLK